MKFKISKSLKTFLTIVAICLMLFGAAGFMMSALLSMGRGDIKKYYNQYPLNEKKGIIVDSQGNIYIGERESGSIQVYDSLGYFQYGFSFPTGGAGWFVFGIDQDRTHIVTARTNSYFIFDKGELVYSQKGINYDFRQELENRYNMTEASTFAISNKVYKISLFNTISIQDKLNGQIEKLYLNTPIWPFPILVFWVIGAGGMGLIFALHHQFLLSMSKWMK